MNRQEYINSKISRKNPEYKYVHKLLREWKIANNITENCVAHHRDDTEETRKYNEEHYELWGFDENGNFIEGKYVVFMTNSEHTSYHRKGITHTEEARKKLSISHQGKKLSETAKAKLSATNKGRKLSDEWRANISASKSGDKNPMYGKKLSDETKTKMSASRKTYLVGLKYLYNVYKNNGGNKKWNDFQTALHAGDITFSDYEITVLKYNDKESENG